MTRRPYRSITSQLTDDHLAAFARAQEAELRGDWEAAASHHLSVPFFERSTHGQRLRTLAGLGDSASAWMIARHLTEVARRLPHREEHALPRAIELGVIVGHPRGIDVARIGCEHPEQVPAYLFARDWVARQADIHEGGALAELLVVADPDLVARSGVRRWAGAPMGGFRVGETQGDSLELVDAESGQEHEVLDLGLTEQVPAGGHVLGRLVPVDAGPGTALDWRPLPIDEVTARAVARSPHHWIEILATRCRAGRIQPGFSYLSESSTTGDLPHQSWTSLLGLGHDHDLGRDRQGPGRVIGRAVDAALRLADRGPDHVRPHRHTIADLMLDPHLTPERLARHATPAKRERWRVLAECLPPHARARATEMMLWCEVPSAG